eukprot:832597-Amphidinium_carterae.1
MLEEVGGAGAVLLRRSTAKSTRECVEGSCFVDASMRVQKPKRHATTNAYVGSICEVHPGVEAIPILPLPPQVCER